METYNFKTNINCSGCVGAVSPFLQGSPDVVKWKVDTENPEKTLTVEVKNINAKDVISLVEKAGFKAEMVSS